MVRTIRNLQLDGGCRAFDFINTVNTRRPAPDFEYLKTFEDFLEWSAKVRSLPKKKIEALQEYAAVRRNLALTAHRNVINARETFYKLFSAIAAGESPEQTVVNEFNEILSDAFQKINMKFRTTGAEVHLNKDEISLDEPLNAIIKSAFDILTRAEYYRIKECPRCGWIFLDTSKNGRRRWCDMNVCGSREKALEYYYRNKHPDQ